MVIGFNKQFPDKIQAGTKKHTIREDKHDRWHAGMKMHMATGVRTKNYKCFKLDVCKSIQRFHISYIGELIYIFIDGKEYWTNTVFNHVMLKKITFLAQNDGFSGMKSFLEWFNKDFEGKLIHWTDLRY